MSTTLVPVDRIRNGQPAAAEIVATYTDTGRGLPVLTICSGWRKTLSSWRAEDVLVDCCASHAERESEDPHGQRGSTRQLVVVGQKLGAEVLGQGNVGRVSKGEVVPVPPGVGEQRAHLGDTERPGRELA